MTITAIDQEIAHVQSPEPVITGVDSALDFIATVGFETGCKSVVIDKAAVCEEFFDLSTRIAGEVLQKFINYRVRLAIVGDFSGYTSKSLRDFIYESNKGNDIFFVSTPEEAVEKLKGRK